MTMLRATLAVLFVLAAAPVAAGDAPAAKSEARQKSRITCSSERETGSHIRRRTCMTQAQQEERRKRDQEAMDRVRTSPQAMKSSD